MASKNFRHVQHSVLMLVVLVWSGLVHAQVRVERTTFPAKGPHEAVVSIDAPGRYSIQAHSEQGTRVEVVDWMAGPMAADGQIGKQDGRLDLLLDVGSYKIRLDSHPEGSGELRLNVLPFREAHAVERPDDIPVLNDLRLYEETLGDLLQQSFWLYVPERQVLRLEALGRNLTECRLWQDGEWLVAVDPLISMYEPEPGQPMTHVEFFHDLNAGLYRLTCYGGEPLAWSAEASADIDEHPFYLRMGIPDIGAVGRRMLTMSPFGRDSFVVSGDTDFLELSRREKQETTLRVGTRHEQGTRFTTNLEAAITKESRDPWCSVRPGRTQEPRIVTVQAAPGDRLMLNYFISASTYTFPRASSPRAYWIAAHASREAGDALDLTAYLSRKWRGYASRVSVEHMRVLNLGEHDGIARTINLLGDVDAYVYVREPGTYIVQQDPEAGGKGRYRLERVLFSKPENYRAPEFQGPDTAIQLSEGLHVLTVTPEAKGIVSFVLRHAQDVAADAAVPTADAEERRSRQRLVWPRVELAPRDEYVLTLSRRHGVETGLLVRPLPLDLADPLPVTLLPDEEVPMQVEVTEASTLLIENDGNAPYRISGYADPITSGATLLPGRYTLTLRNTGRQAAFFSVRTVPAQAEPPLSKDNLARRMQASRKNLPVLTEDAPVFENFERGERRHYALRVEEPGLYRLETSGRLATSLWVRTRFVTSLFSAQANGIGRNALVQQYLRPGDYQVTVRPEGESTGRAGIHLRRVPLTEDAGLAPGGQKKIYLPPDAAVRYRFEIEEAGEYVLRTLGLNKTYAWRLEDHDGWPLVEPNQTGPIRRYFDAGAYHYFSLPDDVEGRRITTLEPVPPPRPELQGKGPHEIALNNTIEHVWREEAGRPPDRFVIFMPDPVKATVSVSKDMLAEMYGCRVNAPSPCSKLDLPAIRGGKDRVFTFQPGYFEVRVSSLDTTDRLPYALSVTTRDLVTGLRYPVEELPAEFTVKTGDERLVELFSSGAVDVKATLADTENRIVAANDDTVNDWNFRIARKLPPGAYTLRVEPVGGQYAGELEVAMAKRGDVEFPAQTAPCTLDAEIGRDVGSVAFTANPGLSRIHAAGNGVLKLAVFQGERLLTEGEREIHLPLRSSQEYTLTFWRDDDGEGPVTLSIDAIPAQEVDLSNGSVTIDIPAADESSALKLLNAHKQSYAIQSRRPVRFSPGADTPLAAVADGPVVLPEASGWLMVDADASAETPLTIAPFALDDDVEVVRLGQDALPFDVAHAADTPLLLDIESAGATVGAVVAEQTQYRDDLVNWPGAWRSPSRTLLGVVGAGAYRGRIWPTSDAPIKGTVRVTRREFSRTTELELNPSGRHEGRIPAGEAHIFPIAPTGAGLSGYPENPTPSLPKGEGVSPLSFGEGSGVGSSGRTHMYDLLLSKDLVAFAWNNGAAEAFAAAVDGNTQQRINVTGGHLIVLNTGQGAGLYRIEKNDAAGDAAGDTAQPFEPVAGFEQAFRAPGRLVLDVPAHRQHIYVDGDRIESRFLRDDGRIIERAGTLELAPSAGGRLEIDYQSGYVRVWRSTPEDQARDKIQPHNLPPFADLPLEACDDGVGVLQDAPQRWRITLAEPQYVVIEADAPGMMALVADNQVLASSIGSRAAGHHLRYFLPAGKYALWTRPLQGVAQQGAIRMQAVTPYDLDGAMLKSWLIAPGETQVFRFDVATESTVGVGVETESDRLWAELRDEAFTLLASGPLMLEKLDAGTYLCIVRPNADGAAPVRYRPVVYGHTGSDQGIPDDVVKEYQQFTSE